MRRAMGSSYATSKASEYLAGARRLAGKSSAHEPFHTNKDDCLRLNSSHF